MLKILLKIWPGLTVIAIYLIYVLLVQRKNKKDNIIEGDYKIVGQNDKKSKLSQFFSLDNKNFVIILYISLILTILSLFYLAFSQNLVQDQLPYEEMIKDVKNQ